MKMSRTMTTVAFLTVLSLGAAGCNSGLLGGTAFFDVFTTVTVNGIQVREPNVQISGSAAFLSQCAQRPNGVSHFGDQNAVFTNSQGAYRQTNPAIACTWISTRFPSSQCSALSTVTHYVYDGATAPLPCTVQASSFGVSPLTVDVTAPPASIMIQGQGISTTYGMPKVYIYDEYSNLLGQVTATSVNGAGTELQMSPSALLGLYSAEYGLVVLCVSV